MLRQPRQPLVHWSCRPEVNDKRCSNFKLSKRYKEDTPQDCAEKCQEVFGDTIGLIDFTPATFDCRCCNRNSTFTLAGRSTYWSKPCGGPSIPCGDNGVDVSDLPISTQENNMHGQHRISGVYWPDRLRRRVCHYAGNHLNQGGQQQHSLRVLQPQLSYRTSSRVCCQQGRLLWCRLITCDSHRLKNKSFVLNKCVYVTYAYVCVGFVLMVEVCFCHTVCIYWRYSVPNIDMNWYDIYVYISILQSEKHVAAVGHGLVAGLSRVGVLQVVMFFQPWTHTSIANAGFSIGCLLHAMNRTCSSHTTLSREKWRSAIFRRS